MDFLDDQIKFLEVQCQKQRQLFEKEEKILAKSRENALISLNAGNISHQNALTVLENIEDKMSLTTKTIAISDKLKQLQSQKKAWQDGIKYAQSYLRFNDEKL